LHHGVRALVVVVLDALEDAPNAIAGRVLVDHAGMVSALAHDFDESELVALSRIEQLLQDEADQVQVLGVLEEGLHHRLMPCARARARANFGCDDNLHATTINHQEESCNRQQAVNNEVTP
tara:strand:- start:138 stop:500 length:363 start_codon:yes stop_codon:yes gene_type:complete